MAPAENYVLSRAGKYVVRPLSGRSCHARGVFHSFHEPAGLLRAAERLMQEHQVRRIPVVDAEGRVIGIVSQADLALKDKPERIHKTVAEISKPTRPSIMVA